MLTKKSLYSIGFIILLLAIGGGIYYYAVFQNAAKKDTSTNSTSTTSTAPVSTTPTFTSTTTGTQTTTSSSTASQTYTKTYTNSILPKLSFTYDSALNLSEIKNDRGGEIPDISLSNGKYKLVSTFVGGVNSFGDGFYCFDSSHFQKINTKWVRLLSGNTWNYVDVAPSQPHVPPQTILTTGNDGLNEMYQSYSDTAKFTNQTPIEKSKVVACATALYQLMTTNTTLDLQALYPENKNKTDFSIYTTSTDPTTLAQFDNIVQTFKY